MMNNDLISRAALLELAHNHVGGTVDCNDIARFPAMDAEPVRHGRWAHLGGDEWCCTQCGDVIHTEGSWEKPMKKYCNECGTKMDAEVQHGKE